MKTLYLLRHAKSSWDEPAIADHERPLAPRGRRATKLLAKHIRRTGLAPELVLCSTARRARETFEGIAAALGEQIEVRFEPELYAASADTLRLRIERIPEEVPAAMLVGHNPSIQSLALLLAGGGDELERLRRKYPTGALAALAIPGQWRDARPSAAELVDFVRPKELR